MLLTLLKSGLARETIAFVTHNLALMLATVKVFATHLLTLEYHSLATAHTLPEEQRITTHSNTVQKKLATEIYLSETKMWMHARM